MEKEDAVKILISFAVCNSTESNCDDCPYFDKHNNKGKDLITETNIVDAIKSMNQ
jgi:hypothetical protein